MHRCDICKRLSADPYPVVDHLVCERCLTEGRLSEMPDYASLESHELDAIAVGFTVSSWWNRDLPLHAGR